MRSFANGARNTPVMTPIAQAMNADQQRDVSAWYASAAPHGAGAGSGAGAGAAAAGGASAALTERGRTLASVGDETRQLQACANCHGPGGAGEAPDYPSLRGQPVSYFTAAMNEWKSGARKTDPSGQMPAIAQRLAADQVNALALWFASLPPAAPAQRSNVAAGTRARPAVAARSDGAGPPPASAAAGAANPSGAGSEQGAPLTGGSQGPGGGGGAAAGNPGQAGGASNTEPSRDGRATGTARPAQPPPTPHTPHTQPNPPTPPTQPDPPAPPTPPVPARPPDLPTRPPD